VYTDGKMHPVDAIFAGYFAPGAVAGFALVKFWSRGPGALESGRRPSAGLTYC